MALPDAPFDAAALGLVEHRCEVADPDIVPENGSFEEVYIIAGTHPVQSSVPGSMRKGKLEWWGEAPVGAPGGTAHLAILDSGTRLALRQTAGSCIAHEVFSTRTITGVVKDTDGAAVHGAHVEGCGGRTESDDEGVFVLSIVEDEAWSCDVQATCPPTLDYAGRTSAPVPVPAGVDPLIVTLNDVVYAPTPADFEGPERERIIESRQMFEGDLVWALEHVEHARTARSRKGSLELVMTFQAAIASYDRMLDDAFCYPVAQRPDP